MKTFLCVSDSFRGSDNLGLDEFFLDTISPGDLMLYFYINENAVIIGKNQNPFKECDLAAMERDEVELVRRVSGGGAVYHDRGNLNFSFIAGAGRYDQDGQMRLILDTVRTLGIPCEFSGRNDLLANGKKFSGNAFAVRRENRQHHGTLLVSADLEKVRRYLTVDPGKIRSKGIDSVRSRVCNLSEIRPGLTVPEVRDALIESFRRAYGEIIPFAPSASDAAAIARYRAKHASWDWRVGQTPKFDLAWDKRFLWGGVELLFSLEKGMIREVHAFSDAMDADLCPALEKAFAGQKLEKGALLQASLPLGAEGKETVRAFVEEI